jgi:hypothetical protein
MPANALTKTRMLGVIAAAVGVFASAGAQGLPNERWFDECEQVGAASEHVQRWLDSPAGTAARSCFLADGRHLVVLVGLRPLLWLVDLEQPQAEPQELLRFGDDVEIEEFIAVNGQRFALLHAGDRQGNRRSFTDYMLLVPGRSAAAPVRVVELWSAVYLYGDPDPQLDAMPAPIRALHRFRSGPSTFVEVESMDLSLSLLPLQRRDGKVQALALRSQFAGVAVRFPVLPASIGLEPLGVRDFLAAVRRHLPHAVVRTGVPAPRPPDF